jgi:hypothetical protein
VPRCTADAGSEFWTAARGGPGGKWRRGRAVEDPGPARAAAVAVGSIDAAIIQRWMRMGWYPELRRLRMPAR